ILGLGQHRAHECGHLVIRRSRVVRLLLLRGATVHSDIAARQQGQRIDAKHPGNDEDENDAANTEPATRATDAAAPDRDPQAAAPQAASALVFDIAGLAATLPFHITLSCTPRNEPYNATVDDTIRSDIQMRKNRIRRP